MASKKKRPPRQVWIAYAVETGETHTHFSRRRDARNYIRNRGFDHDQGLAVAGPYVLAERVREK